MTDVNWLLWLLTVWGSGAIVTILWILVKWELRTVPAFHVVIILLSAFLMWPSIMIDLVRDSAE